MAATKGGHPGCTDSHSDWWTRALGFCASGKEGTKLPVTERYCSVVSRVRETVACAGLTQG